MSIPLKIYQYQAVVYTDTTTGASPFTLSWAFPGGAPTGGTSSTEVVFYNVPGYYTTSLTAIDIYGTTRTLVEPSLIEVSASSLIGGISGPTPSVVRMNEGYQLDDASVGDPYPATSWFWTLPYGITAGTQNVGVTGYVDWYTLTGTYVGAPGSIYNGSIYLTANNGYNPSSASSIIQVEKLGPPEILFLNATGPASSTLTAGFAGSVPISPVFPYQPISTIDFDYSVDHWMVKTNFRFRGTSNNTNEYFHSTNESGLITILTGLWNYQNFTDIVPGFIIIDALLYNSYSLVPVNSAISSGFYVIQNQSQEFFLADESDFLEGLYNNNNYSIQLINTMLSNPYKLLHSGNLQYANTSRYNFPPGLTGMSFVDPNGLGASGDNPMVYSSYYLQNLTGTPPTPPNPIYTVYISTMIAGVPYGATAQIGFAGVTGNDPLTGGNFFVAQDNSNGLGFVRYLNNAINTSIPGGTGTIDFVASEIFNCDYNGPSGASYNPTNYNGAALRILNNSIVQSVSLSDNSQIINSSYTTTPTFPVAPFTADPSNTQGSTETCSGIGSTILMPIAGVGPLAYNSFILGGTVGYP
jgi:hypothetical protein